MKGTSVFLLLTFTLSWSLVGIFRLTGGTSENMVGFIITAVLYMFMPGVSALLTQKYFLKEKPGTGLLLSFKLNKWFLVAWLIMPVLSFATFAVSVLMPGVDYSPEMEGMIKRFEHMVPPEQIEATRKSLEMLPVHPIWLTLLQGLVAGVTINAIAGLGEELGWRGFLLRQFRKMPFFQAALIIGFIWGVWHAPLILMGHNYPEHPVFGVAMMTIFCMLLSPFFLYLTLRARSVIAAAILHGTLNATAGLAIMMVVGGNDLIVGMTGVAGFIVLILAIIALWIYDHLISKSRRMTSVIGDTPWNYGPDLSPAGEMEGYAGEATG